MLKILLNIIALLHEVIEWLYNGLIQNAAAFLCAYVAIIIEALWNRYSREQSAKQAYFSLLGNFMEHNTIPNEKGLASLKKDFSRRFNVKASSFPIKEEALKELRAYCIADTAISLEHKALMQEKITMFCETFLALDSRIEAVPYYKSYCDTLFKDSIIQFGAVWVLLILSNPPDSFETAFIQVFWAAVGAFWGIVLYWLVSLACYKVGLCTL